VTQTAGFDLAKSRISVDEMQQMVPGLTSGSSSGQLVVTSVPAVVGFAGLDNRRLHTFQQPLDAIACRIARQLATPIDDRQAGDQFVAKHPHKIVFALLAASAASFACLARSHRHAARHSCHRQRRSERFDHTDRPPNCCQFFKEFATGVNASAFDPLLRQPAPPELLAFTPLSATLRRVPLLSKFASRTIFFVLGVAQATGRILRVEHDKTIVQRFDARLLSNASARLRRSETAGHTASSPIALRPAKHQGPFAMIRRTCRPAALGARSNPTLEKRDQLELARYFRIPEAFVT